MNEMSVHVLRTKMTGEFLLPGDGRWFAALEASNLAASQEPVAFVRPNGAADVAAVVEFARVNGLQIVDSDHDSGALALAVSAESHQSRQARRPRTFSAPWRIAPQQP